MPNENTFKLTIEINLDNAAFDGNARQETARIVRDFVTQLHEAWPIAEEFDYTQRLKDINGQAVGKVHMQFMDK
jgi:hypothetical protein